MGIYILVAYYTVTITTAFLRREAILVLFGAAVGIGRGLNALRFLQGT
jgi:hypothetical protein